MSCLLRVEYPGALYHVVAQGNGRLWLFKHDKARLVKHPGEYKYSSLWYIMRRDKSIRWFDPKASLFLIGGRRALAELLADRDIPASMKPVYNQFNKVD